MVPKLAAALGYQKARHTNEAYIFHKFDDLHIKADASQLADVKLNSCEVGPARKAIKAR